MSLPASVMGIGLAGSKFGNHHFYKNEFSSKISYELLGLNLAASTRKLNKLTQSHPFLTVDCPLASGVKRYV